MRPKPSGAERAGQHGTDDPQRRLVHDLNNHLAVILGRAELLAARFASDEQTLAELTEIISNIQKMSELIKNSRRKLSASLTIPRP